MSELPGGLDSALAKIDSRWKIHPGTRLETLPQEFSAPTAIGDSYKNQLDGIRAQLRPLQRKLYAGKQAGVLVVFQALDAAGKDGAIREVFEGLDVAGVRVAAFKAPSSRELAHDFLWRVSREAPGRGMLVAFNRSHYEEVLVVRVHPEYLAPQYGGNAPASETLWPERYRSINEWERHLAIAGTVVLKFWLNVSPQRQAQRFLERLEDERRQWKFSAGDVAESDLRADYDRAVVEMFNATSTPWAPWFCIPADDRWYARQQIASILLQTLQQLNLSYPAADSLNEEQRQHYLQKLRQRAGNSGSA